MENQSLLFGAEVRYSMHDYSHSGTSGTIAVDPEKRNGPSYRAFIQDEITLGDLSITPGIKYGYNTYVASQWEPSLKLGYTPSTTQTLWLSLSRSVATPSRIESDGYLDFNSFSSNCSAVGGTTDPTLGCIHTIAVHPLKPTIQNAYEAGYRIRPKESFFIDIATFYNNYQTTTPKSVDMMYGAELNLVFQPSDLLKAEASYTYNNGETNAKNDLTNLQKNMVNGHINYNPLSNLQTDLYYYYYGSTQTVDAVHRFDFHVGYQASKMVFLEFIGQNLFNPEHVEPNQDATITLNTQIEQAFLLKATLSF